MPIISVNLPVFQIQVGFKVKAEKLIHGLHHVGAGLHIHGRYYQLKPSQVRMLGVSNDVTELMTRPDGFVYVNADSCLEH